jgi:hypothetical protein
MYHKMDTILSIGIDSAERLRLVLNELQVMIHQDRPDEFVIDLLELGENDVTEQDIFDWLGISDETALVEQAESVRFLRLFLY